MTTGRKSKIVVMAVLAALLLAACIWLFAINNKFDGIFESQRVSSAKLSAICPELYTPTKPVKKFESIRMERRKCLTLACDELVYKVAVYGDGRAEYEGGTDENVIRKMSQHLDGNALAEMAEALGRFDYRSYKGNYQACSEKCGNCDKQADKVTLEISETPNESFSITYSAACNACLSGFHRLGKVVADWSGATHILQNKYRNETCKKYFNAPKPTDSLTGFNKIVLEHIRAPMSGDEGFTVTIDSYGNVQYDGSGNSLKVKGAVESKLSDDQMKRVLAAVNDADFFNVPDDCTLKHPHFPMGRLTISANNLTRTIEYGSLLIGRCGRFQRLFQVNELDAEIKEIINIEQWIGSREEHGLPPCNSLNTSFEP